MSMAGVVAPVAPQLPTAATPVSEAPVRVTAPPPPRAGLSGLGLPAAGLPVGLPAAGLAPALRPAGLAAGTTAGLSPAGTVRCLLMAFVSPPASGPAPGFFVASAGPTSGARNRRRVLPGPKPVPFARRLDVLFTIPGLAILWPSRAL